MSINLTVVIDNEEAVRKFRELQKTARTVTSSVITDADRMDISMRRIATTLGQIGVAASLTGLIRQIALTRGEFQQLEVAFSTLLQSKEKADRLMAEMVDLAAKTPFDLQGVASGARQLLAYGFAAEEITDTLTRLGNVAAGLGLPLERLTYLYGTTAVQGRLYARDMLQFTSSGIPVLQEMAKMYGKTTEEINKMVTDGKIGFEDVRKVIENMTNEGGQFYNLMQEQSKTITGLISNLGDALDTMFNDIGKSQEGVISDVLKGTISLVENYQKVLDILIPLVATYGAYKAALMLTVAAQRINMVVMREAVLQKALALKFGKELTAAQAVEAARMMLVTKGWKALTVAIKANTAALLTNPVFWITAALSAATYGIYKLATADTVQEAAQKKVNVALEEYAQKLDEQKSKAQELHSVMNDDVSTAYSKQKAYENLIKTYPELLKNYSEEEIKLMSIINLTKEINRINETRKKNNIQEGFNNALAEVQRIDALIGTSGQAAQGYSRMLRKAEADLDEWRKKLEDYKKTEFAAAPAEIKIASLQGNIDELTAQNNKIGRLIEEARSKVAQGQYVPYDQSEAYYQAQKQSNVKTIASKQEEISKLQGGGEAVRNKAYWEAQKKEAESALEAIDASQKKLLDAGKFKGIDSKVVESYKKYSQVLRDAESALKAYNSYSKQDSAAEKAREAQKKLNEQVIANDQALLDSRIAIMKEGKAKELAEIGARTKAKLDAIDKERKEEEDRAKKAGVKLSPQREAIFTERERNARKQADNDRIAVELKYAEDLDKVYKQITDDVLSEDDRRIRGIKDKYQDFRKWVESALKGGTINLEQAIALEWEIDSAEITASLKTIVDEYGSTEDKIAKIREKAANARKAVTESGRMDLIPRIDKREREEVGEVKAEELMKTDDWINLFQNLDALSSKEIRRIIDSINEQLKNANLDPINLKSVTDQLDKAAETATRKNPFAAITTNFKAYKQALANGDDLRAVKLRQEAWQSVASAIGEAGNTLNSVSGLLGQFGIESAELDGFIGAINSLASIDITNPFSIASGVIGGLSSLIGGIFGGHDKRAEKRIEKLQNQVDALQKSYEDLGDAIDEAYSTDASDLINQQNEMLEQQKVLIQNQIKEEQSKKDPDKGRIKDWQNQIDEINKVIADNKEKAIDAIFGEDLKTAIENFADAYSEAWASGGDRAKASKDVVKNMMRQMVVESIKAAMQSSEAMAKIREKLLEFYSDNTFSKWEQDYIYKMADDLQKELDKKFGWADPLLKDKNTSAQTATSRGFQAMSQDTGDELNGRVTDMQGKMNILVSGMDMLRSINMETRNTSIDIRDIMIQLNGNVADIRAFTKVLPQMSDTLLSMNKKLDNI